MFKIIQLAFQVVFKPYSLGDKASCKKFIENILSLIKPMAAANNVAIDDAIIANIEKILASDVLFDYFFDLVANQSQTEEVIFESVDEAVITDLCERACDESNEEMPEAISPLVIISLATQIISLINALKKIKAE